MSLKVTYISMLLLFTVMVGMKNIPHGHLCLDTLSPDGGAVLGEMVEFVGHRVWLIKVDI